MRPLLRAAYAAALAHVEQRVRTWVPRCVGALGDELRAGGRVLLIAFGKAARTMASEALPALPAGRVHGLLVPPEPDAAPLAPLEVIPGGHPLPSEGSFAAARRALALCRAAGPDDHVVFLVSGGGSAMLELPFDERATVDDWRRLNRALVASGAPIDEINAVRMRLSAIKGGRLAVAAGRAASRRTLYVVDVPGGTETVASGPTELQEPAEDHLRRDVDRLGLATALPAWLVDDIAAGRVPPLPTPDDAPPGGNTGFRIADESHAARGARDELTRRGVVLDDDDVDVDDWPYERAAEHLLRRLDALHGRHPGSRVALVTTGELSVPLPDAPGVGGRNQQFALHCAARISGRPIAVLSCGTDGVDGTAPAAGAVVDGTTCARAAAAGFDVAAHLRRCDAHPLLDAIGDTVVTGPTGLNVRDLRVLVRDA